MIPVFSFLAGLIFGTGLCVSGMIQPSKVLGFLDLAGRWDPSLAFVMAGAISVGAVAFSTAGKRTATLLGNAFDIPTKRDIDRRLLTGSLIFGVGWGLSGICPGPAIALLAFGSSQAITFVAAMLAGMLIFELTDQLGSALRQDKAVEDS
jgi:uncharacterized membrane protein YedE/YeeE